MRPLQQIKVDIDRLLADPAGSVLWRVLLIDLRYLHCRMTMIDAEIELWEKAIEPDGGTSVMPVRSAAALLRSVIELADAEVDSVAPARPLL